MTILMDKIDSFQTRDHFKVTYCEGSCLLLSTCVNVLRTARSHAPPPSWRKVVNRTNVIDGSNPLVGHPPARDTSQDGQYESDVRERVNLTPMPGRPEVNHLT